MTVTARPLRDGVFRLLFLGEALASISEQLFVVCLTLLVLGIEGPGATLGLVLAVAAVPTAVLLPFGGLLADRVDPVRIVVATTALRTAAIGATTALVLLGTPPVWLLAGIAAGLGVLDAAYYPASMVLLPRVVAPADLARANAFVQGAESAGDLIGPALAAGLVATVGFGGGFGVVTAGHLLAAVAFAVLVRRLRRRGAAAPAAPVGPAPGALREGLRYTWRTPPVRTTVVVLAVLNLAVAGPVLVGGAVLAEQRLGGAAALSTVFTGFGAGSLLGLVAAGIGRVTRRAVVLGAGTAVIGVGTVALGFVGDLVLAAAAAAVIGLGAGYLGVVLVAWLQELVPTDLQGRVMSLVALAVVAIDPLSYALAGLLLPLGVTVLFASCGGLVLLTAVVAASAHDQGLRPTAA